MMTTKPRPGAPLRLEASRSTSPLVLVDYDPLTGDVVASFTDEVPEYDFDELVDGVSVTFDAHHLGRLVSAVLLGQKAGRSPTARMVFDALVGRTVALAVSGAMASGTALHRSAIPLDGGAEAALGLAWKTLHASARARLYAPGAPVDGAIGSGEPDWNELPGVLVLATPATAAERLRAEPSRRMPLPPSWAVAAGLGDEILVTEEPGLLRVRVAAAGAGPAPVVRLADPPHGDARLAVTSDGYEGTIRPARPLGTAGLNNLVVLLLR